MNPLDFGSLLWWLSQHLTEHEVLPEQLGAARILRTIGEPATDQRVVRTAELDNLRPALAGTVRPPPRSPYLQDG
jgi:hypothetical protein